jgi:hypothetical protein
MNSALRLLHVTDSHVLVEGGDHQPHDIKVDIHADLQSRAEVFDLLFKRIAEETSSSDERLDGVIFSGDALARGQAGGNRLLLELVQKHFGLGPQRILAVPGNHDVPKGSQPGSKERYQDFLSVWRDAKCITPWLDVIDAGEVPPDWTKHVLLAGDNSWAVMAVNSCNWSHANAEISQELKAVWPQLAAGVSGGDDKKKAIIEKELQSLIQHDAAHISRRQFECIREMFEILPAPKTGRQLRMVVLHHHLRNPSLRLEFKTMPDLIPLENFREMLSELDVRVVFHGHKHVWRQHFDYIESRNDPGGVPHKVLMLAGGTFSDQNESHAAGRVRIDGLPWAPTIRVETFATPDSGLKLRHHPGPAFRLWEYAERKPSEPTVVIQGSNFDEVYAKVHACATSEARAAPLVVQLDLPSTEPLWRLPQGYPTPVAEQRRDGWLEGLVHWWQRRDSQLEKRIPYIHGNRLLKYGNNLDQMHRVVRLLKAGNTSRAIAILVDPRLDFEDDQRRTEFASFCMVQFIRRRTENNECIDVVGYYRAQEMRQWWPINVAELRHLQRKVIEGGVRAAPGRITTITASARVDDAPSPTHVAMPLIDRWLDQSPEKFFQLATFMLNGKVEHGGETVVQEWIDELEALQESARRPAHDGGPVVAIDGPDRLATYLRAGTGVNIEDCQKLARVLDGIARHSEGRPNDPTHWPSWQRIMEDQLSSAIVLSRQTLGLRPTS